MERNSNSGRKIMRCTLCGAKIYKGDEYYIDDDSIYCTRCIEFPEE